MPSQTNESFPIARGRIIDLDLPVAHLVSLFSSFDLSSLRLLLYSLLRVIRIIITTCYFDDLDAR